jgi:hypothetical protein
MGEPLMPAQAGTAKAAEVTVPDPPPPVELMVTTPVPPTGEIVTFVPAMICETPEPTPGGTAQVPSARRKFAVPPPEAATAPAVDEEKSGICPAAIVPEINENE